MKKNKSILKTLITLALLLTISSSTLLLPNATAHTPAWQIPTYAFINIAPNPVGIGQQALVVFWIDKTMPSAAVANSIRVHDYELIITDPDGETQTLTWPVINRHNLVAVYTVYP
jgi:hypothetical protein